MGTERRRRDRNKREIYQLMPSMGENMRDGRRRRPMEILPEVQLLQFLADKQLEVDVARRGGGKLG